MGGVEQLTNLRQGSLNLALQRGNPQTLLGGAQGLSGLFLQAMGGVYRKVSGLSRSWRAAASSFSIVSFIGFPPLLRFSGSHRRFRQ